MPRILTLFILLLLSSSAFAVFCPKGFNQMNVGDTIEQVQQQCGKPDSQKTSQAESSGPQEWSFYLNPNNAAMQNTGDMQDASLKMIVAFDNNKVINITVNSISLAATPFCGSSIAVGNTTETVKKICGNPAFINKSNQQNTTKPEEIMEWKYNSVPPVSLFFLNGKLKNVKS